MKISLSEHVNTPAGFTFVFTPLSDHPLLCPQIILHRLNGHSRLSSGMTVHPRGGTELNYSIQIYTELSEIIGVTYVNSDSLP